MIASSLLHGWSYEKASLMGMPHVGAFYRGQAARLEDGAKCVVCGAMASNAHHVVPKSRGTVFNLATEWGVFPLRSPLFALCGSGTTGCHDGFHGGAIYTVDAVWDDRDAEAAWWDGTMLKSGVLPNSFQLFAFMHYRILRNGEIFKEVVGCC